MKNFAVLGCFIAISAHGVPPEGVNADSRIVQDFENRLAGYMRLHDAVKADLPHLKQTSASGAITHHEHEFAQKIREARKPAGQGAIFSPEIAAEFRSSIGIAMQGPEALRIRQSLHQTEPVRLRLRVNHEYPASFPLQSTPPTLLLNLPPLPAQLEYGVVDHALVLLDVEANLIVDFIPNAVP